MPYTYHNFDPWAKAAQNISAGLIAAQQARARQAMHQQEMEMQRPLIAARTAEAETGAMYNQSRTEGQNIDNKLSSWRLDEIKRVAPIMERGTRLENGFVIMTEEAAKANAGLITTLAKDAADLGAGTKSSIQGMSHNANARAERRNKRQMNQDDNAAAMERTKVMTGSRSSKMDSIGMQEAKDRVMLYEKKVADLGPRPANASKVDSSGMSWMDKYEFYNSKLMGARKDLKRFSTDAPQNPLTPPPASGNSVSTPAAKPQLDVETAKKFLLQAGGDKQKARQMALDAGYAF